MDYYEAAEMIARCWFDMSGRYLPAIDIAPHRRTTRPIDHDTVSESTHARTPRALRQQLRRVADRVARPLFNSAWR